MQIGCFTLDLQRRELVDTKHKRVIELSNDEFNILYLLKTQKNKVVSKQLLLNELKEHAYPELELVDVIYQLRRHLGSDFESLIETVADQGYLLHSELKKSKSSLLDAPRQGMSTFAYCVLTGSLLLLVFWFYSGVEPSHMAYRDDVQMLPVQNCLVEKKPFVEHQYFVACSEKQDHHPI